MYSSRGATVYALPAGRSLSVGRGPDADVTLDDDAVSRRHAIFHGGPPVEIEDLGSANGTYVARTARRPEARDKTTADQRRVPVQSERAQLGEGDTVHIGAAVFVVRRAADEARTGGAGGDADAAADAWLEGFDAIVIDPAVRRVYEEAARIAPMSLPVLILGETGVGKDVLARFIHHRSGRAKQTFVAQNCATLGDTLADSELFGHERGAFTGAHAARAGLFETASGGTVFLDEIGELPLTTQAKLLRVLEASEVQRLGSARAVRVDVRLVSATNRDLERAALQGAFRQDLFFRVNGVALRVPPLRERRVEIGALARRFVEAPSRELGLAAAPPITDDALRALEAYAWPGNVRELRFVMERTIASAGPSPITREHLPAHVLQGASGDATAGRTRASSASRADIIAALAASDGNQTRAAEALGISRRTLINRMIEFGLPRPRKGA